MSARFWSACLASAGLLLAGAAAAVAAAPMAARYKCRPAARLVTCTYQVADLVVPIETFDEPEKGPAATQADRLVELIVTSVQPGTWAATGGPGTIDYFPLTMALVVKQTAEAHAQLEGLLRALRRLQDVEVATEMRIVSVPESFRASAGLGLSSDVAVLDDGAVARLLEAVQGDARSHVLQAPKLTTFNGQKAAIVVAEKQAYVTGLHLDRHGEQVAVTPQVESFETGVKLGVRPTVAPDRRSVSVQVKVSLTSLEAPEVPLFPVVLPLVPKQEGGDGQPVAFTQFIQQPRFRTLAVEKTVQVGEGRTAVLDLGARPCEACNESGPPVLRKVPYVNRLFKAVGGGRQTERVFLLVTPRIVVQEEEEERHTGFRAPQSTSLP
jgi:Flp pilus assembly secretin CpaC